MPSHPVIRIKNADLVMDGEYELDLSSLTNRELHRIKQISGVTAPGFLAAVIGSDTAFVVALAMVALERAGKFPDEELLWDAQGGSIKLEFPGADDKNPPAEGPSGEAENAKPSSGAASETSSANQENDLSPTGEQT